MSARAFVVGAALAGASVTLFGCGSGETTATPAPAPFTCRKSATVAEAWGNHFEAFGAFDLDKIMCDYDETSTIAVFNDKCAGGAFGSNRIGYSEYKGTAAIRGFFSALFDQLGRDGSKLDKVGPVDQNPIVMNENGPGGNVFLTWRTKDLEGANIIEYATDSFSWRQVDGQSLIWKQNIVTTEPNKDCPNGGAATDPSPDPTDRPEPIRVAWKNHFDAFAAGVTNPNPTAWQTAMAREYDDDSIVQVFDTRTETYTKYTGWAEIEGMFTQLFADIDAAKVDPPTGNPLADAGIAVPIQEVMPAYSDVFLVWQSNKHLKATDTFVFNAAGDKIVRQNIVVQTTAPAAEAKVLV